MSSRTRAGALLLVILLGTGTLAWWRSRPLDITPAAETENLTCRRAAARLPQNVFGAPRTATRPTHPAVAAWGRPAVRWRCGVQQPRATERGCLGVNGIDWVLYELRDGTEFRSFSVNPAVQVLVPRREQPAEVLTDFGPALREFPSSGRRCS